MTAVDLVVQENEQLTPASVAANLLDVIKDIELSIENAGQHVSKIEKRGWFKSLFSSSKTDLVTISKSQNGINDLMLGLIQEIITLNVMSYSFLASVISELEMRAREGWTNSEGQFQALSSTGRDFADKARGIFLKIAEGSKKTQQRIELNTESIREIKSALAVKVQEVARHGQEIVHLQKELLNKSQRLTEIDTLLLAKQSLDDQQTHAIQAIVEELRRNGELDHERALEIKTLERELELAKGQTAVLTAQLTRQDKFFKAALGLLGALCVVSLAISFIK